VRAPTVGALGEAKRGEKAQFTRVNENFEPVFNTAIAENGLVQRSQHEYLERKEHPSVH